MEKPRVLRLPPPRVSVSEGYKADLVIVDYMPSSRLGPDMSDMELRLIADRLKRLAKERK